MEEENGFSLEEILEQYYSKNRGTEDGDDIDGERYEYRPEPVLAGEANASDTPVITRLEVCDWFESVIASLTAVLIIMIFIARTNQVYGISMQPTLTEGDRLIVMPIYSMPDYGDIIIVEAENLPNSRTGEMGEQIVKRVIGLPGDKIFIDRESGEVFRNDEKLEEAYIAEKIHPDKVGNQIYPLIVRENHVFVMGDNRNHSTDSRYGAGRGVHYYVGCVNMGNIIGKAAFRIYPFEEFGIID